MKDWAQFAKTRTESSQNGAAPKVLDYFLIKLVDNWLAAGVLLLLIFFVLLIIFTRGGAPQDVEVNKWLTHCAGLCLGVFLGLLKK